MADDQDNLAQLEAQERRLQRQRQRAAARSDSDIAPTTEQMLCASPYMDFLVNRVLVVLGLLVVATGALIWHYATARGGDTAAHEAQVQRLLWACGIGVAAYLLAYAGGRLTLGGAWQRELAWLRSLPFAVEGYLPGLGGQYVRHEDSALLGHSQTFKHVAWVQFAVTYRAGPPPDEEMQALLADFDSNFLRFYHADRWQVGGIEVGHDLRKWLHRLAAKALLPMHARHPIAAVRITVGEA